MRTLNRKSENASQKPFDPFLSSAKFIELEKKVKKLKEVDRPRLTQEVSRLAELGDFSENVEYQLAKGKLRHINSKILVLENQIKQTKIIAIPKQFDTIQIGHKVIVEVNGKQKTYQILGSYEADPTKGVISYGSPIGSALLGHRVGDMVKIKPVDREMEYTIVEIT